MDQLAYMREQASFDEKIALAKLEEAKAAERTRELEYQKTRFQMDWLTMVAKSQEQAQMAAAQQQGEKKNAG